MNRIVSIGLVVGTLAMAGLPAFADDQSTGILIGTPGSPHWARASVRQAPNTSRQLSAAFAYADYAQGAGLREKTCGHVGGPKTGTWTCQ